MHSISGSSIAGKYERELVVILKPARRNRSMVAFSRLPLGMPSLSFIDRPLPDRRNGPGSPPSGRPSTFERSSFGSARDKRRDRALPLSLAAHPYRNRSRFPLQQDDARMFRP